MDNDHAPSPGLRGERPLFRAPGLDTIPQTVEALERASDVLRKIAQVCDFRAGAMRFRAKGEHRSADEYDMVGKRIEGQLPEWAKSQSS